MHYCRLCTYKDIARKMRQYKMCRIEASLTVVMTGGAPAVCGLHCLLCLGVGLYECLLAVAGEGRPAPVPGHQHHLVGVVNLHCSWLSLLIINISTSSPFLCAADF